MSMRSANKVALNTGILYGRMILSMSIALYSTRLVLDALGSTDYGIFNLIAGLIAMLSFLNTAMTASTQRFLSYYQGKSDLGMQKSVFTNSLILHICLGFFIVLCLEILGNFLFNGFLNIPADRLISAKAVYQYMAATVFFTVANVPFTGTLNARENMLVLAIVNILESLLKLAIALSLPYILNDKLEMFGLLTAGVTVLTFTLYAGFCIAKYEECSLVNLFRIDRELLKELTSFAGWNLFGTLCSLGRTQGIAVMLNLFFGAIINAAYGIANQVAGQLNFFSYTLLQAINPQIMKSEGANDRQRMLRLSMMASKFCFFLMAIVSVPCLFEMEAILKFWLKEVPAQTVTFCSLIVLGTLTNQLTIGLQSAVQATGQIKRYQSVIGSVILLNLPIAYFMLRLGLPAYTALISYAIIEAIACAFRLYFLNRIAGLSVKFYIHTVLAREIVPLLSSITVCLLITYNYHGSFRFLLTGAASSLIFLLTIAIFGLAENEKQFVNSIFKKLKKIPA